MASQRYTAKEVRDAIDAANGVVAQAARMLGCSPRTVYNYADRYVTVKEAIEKSRIDLAAEAETHLVQMMRDAENPNVRYKAVKDILRNYHPDDWTDHSQSAELSGEGGEPIRITRINTPPEPDE